jgi:N-carbamoylputrescine amidase
MKAAVCELPTNLDPHGAAWASIREEFKARQLDLIVLDELPFGPWLPLSNEYDAGKARASVELHAAALEDLADLAPVVISSRPVPAGQRIANEAFALVHGAYVPLHQKHYFPAEEAFYETSWFQTERPGFDVQDLPSVRVGVQLCSELMFNEWSRRYGREGAQLIAVPRSSGVSVLKWQAGLVMAAAVSGSYVLSSNRAGREGDMTFGGRGFVYAPGGELLAETSPDQPIAVVELDFEKVEAAQSDWPCYISELKVPA